MVSTQFPKSFVPRPERNWATGASEMPSSRAEPGFSSNRSLPSADSSDFEGLGWEPLRVTETGLSIAATCTIRLQKGAVLAGFGGSKG